VKNTHLGIVVIPLTLDVGFSSVRPGTPFLATRATQPRSSPPDGLMRVTNSGLFRSERYGDLCRASLASAGLEQDHSPSVGTSCDETITPRALEHGPKWTRLVTSFGTKTGNRSSPAQCPGPGCPVWSHTPPWRLRDVMSSWHEPRPVSRAVTANDIQTGWLPIVPAIVFSLVPDT
jgi:hypothetical protein